MLEEIRKLYLELTPKVETLSVNKRKWSRIVHQMDRFQPTDLNTLLSSLKAIEAVFKRIDSINNGDLMTPETWGRYKLFFNDVQFPEQKKLNECESQIRTLVTQTYVFTRKVRKDEADKRRLKRYKGKSEDAIDGNGP